MKVFFMNNGEFDKTAMLTFGVSAKGSEDAIGYFGTGFKYAVAIILRLGGDIRVVTNEDTYVFSSKRKEVRGKQFDIVCVNGDETGFTTHMGAKWEPWQAFRELYANCLDEGGEISASMESYSVVVEVDCPIIYECFLNKNTYFLTGEPIIKTPQVEIFEGYRPYYYFRGVAIANCGDSYFSYNILTGVDLTEDRTARYLGYDVLVKIARNVQQMTDKVFLKKILTARNEMERELSYKKDYSYSPEFISVCRDLLNSNQGIPESARRMLKDIEEASGNYPKMELTSVQDKMLSRAIHVLGKISVQIDDYPVNTVRGLGDGVMGRALEGEIYISEIPFNQGVKQLCSTLLEEWVHLKYRCEDFDRQMQSWLFDKILSLAEELVGEPI